MPVGLVVAAVLAPVNGSQLQEAESAGALVAVAAHARSAGLELGGVLGHLGEGAGREGDRLGNRLGLLLWVRARGRRSEGEESGRLPLWNGGRRHCGGFWCVKRDTKVVVVVEGMYRLLLMWSGELPG